MSGKRSRIQCLDRTMDVLEIVGRQGEAGVSEMARALELNVATVHNIVSSLAGRNYLVNRDGRYRIGPALAALASRWDAADQLTRLVDAPLIELARATGESPIVAVLQGTSLRVLATAVGPEEPMVHFPNLTLDDPLLYGTGHVLAAFAPEALWPAFIEQHLPGKSSRSKIVRELIDSFKTIRQTAMAVVERPGEVDSFAVPVHGPGGRVVASVGVSCPAGRSTVAGRKTNLDALARAADTLRRQLDGTSPSKETRSA